MKAELHDSYRPLEDYALIGDCHGSALVASHGSIDWGCLLRMDGSPAFSRLLDTKRGGYWSIRPVEKFEVERRYLERTMILETTFRTSAGKARVYDFFAMHRGGRTHPYRQLIRIIEGIEGTLDFEFVLRPRFDFGTLRPWIRHHPKQGTFSAVGGAEAMVISHPCEDELYVDEEDVSIRGQFTVTHGHRERFSLVSFAAHASKKGATGREELDHRFEETYEWWQEWTARGDYLGNYQEQVMRSALVLKLFSIAPTGAIIAAPTTSLPESLGGTRNWDYRYCWLRDASLTMSALYIIGHQEVADGFKTFIERATAGRAEDVRIMYGPFGERRLVESEVELDGYMGSRPVRIGNAAFDQPQHDVYGEILSASQLWLSAGHRIPEDEWRFLRSLVDRACEIWEEPDNGIWEVRGEPRHFVHSKAMCWLAIRHGLDIAEEEKLPCDRDRWLATKEEIQTAIAQHGVDPERGCFVQYFGARHVDASLLRLSYLGFVEPDDPRMKATVQAVRDELMVDCFVKRYDTAKTKDGCRGDEGTFLICTFWYIDALILEGRVEEADQLFRQVLGVANDLGLFAEQYDRVAKRMLGNYPQAYTHMGVINTAFMLWLAQNEGLGHLRTSVSERFKEFARRPRSEPSTIRSDVHEDE